MPSDSPTAPDLKLPPRYDAAAVQEAVARVWDEERAFHAEPTDPGEPFCIVIPPPNVTGALHLGHALNNTIQDILVRRARMQGKNAVWIPGTDHAGIATQAVVDKRLQAEGLPSLKDYKKLEAEGRNGREQFIAKVQAWKDEYEARIIAQLKAMGCSCDFERTAFTMDEPRAKAVREAFFRLFKDGLIYRGKRLVNWDPATQTALSDDEVENEEIDGHFYYLRYPLEPTKSAAVRGQGFQPVPGQQNGQDAGATQSQPAEVPQQAGQDARATQGQPAPRFVAVATTRPETMLGDTAVAINPRDPRAAELRGRFVRLPIVNRVVPIIEDDYVVLADPDSQDPKAKFATGFLKVTPAHDPNDWDLGQRHGLPVINIFAPDASISDQHGWPREDFEQGDAQQFLGLDRYEARRAIVAWFRENGLLEDVKPYRHSVGHSYRSHVPIEPYLSDQWYVAVKRPIPWLADEGVVEGTEVPKNSLAGLALTALAEGPVRNTGVPPVPALAEEEGHDHVAVRSERPGHGQDARATDGRARASANDSGLSFVPERYARTFRQWHESLRDWCISRQLWWGHRIPVWTKWSDKRGPIPGIWGPPTPEEQAEIEAERAADPNFIERHLIARQLIRDNKLHFVQLFEDDADDDDYPIGAVQCSPLPAEDEFLVREVEEGGYAQDPDVLDTWFSSALWPMSTLGWPDESAMSNLQSPLNVWNPTSVLCTAREIITLWVSRMTMFNRYMRGHPDEEGTKARRHEGTKGPEFEEGAGAPSGTSCLRASVPSCLPVPFRTVFIHAMIQDGEGRKMSKSLGNGVDPLDIISSHGADAMRFTLAQMTTLTQDVRMPVVRDEATGKNTSPKFDLGRNFANKLWNAGRFVIGSIEGVMGTEGTKARRHEGTKGPEGAERTSNIEHRTSNIEGSESGADNKSDPSCLRASVPSCLPVNEQFWSIIDRWILSRLARTVQAVNEAIDEFRFDRYATACYDFFWRDFCDWYVEASKPAMKAGGEQAQQTAHVLATCLDVSLRLMHPMIPFATERLWWALCETMPERGIPGRIMGCASNRLIRAAWPVFDERMDALTSSGAERVVERLQEIVQAIRTVRNENKVDPRKTVPVVIRHGANVGHHLTANKATIELWATCDIVEMSETAAEPANAAKTTAAQCEIFVTGLLDPAADATRLARERADLEKKIKTLRGRLENKGYLDKAPPHLVKQTQDELSAAEAELAALA